MPNNETLTPWQISIRAFVSLITILITPLLTYYIFYIYTPSQTHELKQIDVEMHCNSRWEDLYKAKIEILRQTLSNDKGKKNNDALAKIISRMAENYYNAFWALQQDQFNYYNQGYLPESIYISWIYERLDQFKNDENKKDEIGGISFKDGWNNYGKKSSVRNYSFDEFIEKIRNSPSSADIQGIARSYKEKFTKDNIVRNNDIPIWLLAIGIGVALAAGLILGRFVLR